VLFIPQLATFALNYQYCYLWLGSLTLTCRTW